MASLVYGFIRPCTYLFGYKDFINAKFRAEFDNQKRNINLEYNPYSEIVGTLLKIGIAVGTYFVFSKLMPQDTSAFQKITTGALLYRGLLETVGAAPTDGAVGAWLILQAYSSYKSSPLTSKNVGVIIGQYLLSNAVFFHQFSIFEKMENLFSKNLTRVFDKTLEIPEFKWKDWNIVSIVTKRAP